MTPEEPPTFDFLLQAFVDAANQMDDFSISLTLCVSGGVVTGDLVTAPLWMDEVASLVEMDRSDAAFHVANVYREQAGLYRRRRTQRRGEVIGEVTYIHLRDAQWLIESGEESYLGPDPGIYWRGRLTEIAGWSLGRLPVPSSQW